MFTFHIITRLYIQLNYSKTSQDWSLSYLQLKTQYVCDCSQSIFFIYGRNSHSQLIPTFSMVLLNIWYISYDTIFYLLTDKSASFFWKTILKISGLKKYMFWTMMFIWYLTNKAFFLQTWFIWDPDIFLVYLSYHVV